MEWKEIALFDGMYSVSNTGLINHAWGERSSNSVLSKEQVQEIFDNPQIRNIDFAKKFNIDRSAISKIRRKVNWKKFVQ